MAETVILPSRAMATGDRVMVEPADGDDFEAVVRMCRGWGLVHGVMDWEMQRDDGDLFVYSIHTDAPVRFVNPAPVEGGQSDG